MILALGLLNSLPVYAQSSSSVVGTWNFTIKSDEGGFNGKFNITEVEDGLGGVIDVSNSSVTRNLRDLNYSDGHLTFTVNRKYDTIKIDVNISGDNFKGKWIYADYSVPINGTRQASNDGAIIDHAKVINSLNKKTLQEGKKFYHQVCAACHGANGTSTLPSARSFNSDKFKYGSDPYSMWKTITNGKGQMGAQKWLSPKERYEVIQYIRQELVKPNNPQAYFKVTKAYLDSLPKPLKSAAEIDKEIKANALQGSQEYGQLYFSDHLGNYGNAMYTSVQEHGNGDIVIDLADSLRIGYNVQRLRVDAVWQGKLDLSETKYQKYRGEDEPSINGKVFDGLDRMRWSYQDRYQQLEVLVSDRSPYPSRWLDYHGHYQYGDKVILSYAIMGRDVLEMPSADMVSGMPVIQQTLKIAPGDSWRKLELAGLGNYDTPTVKEGVFALNDVTASQGLKEEDRTQPDRSLVITAPDEGGTLKQFVAAGIQGDTDGMHWIVEDGHQLSLYISPSTKSQTVRVYRISGNGMSQLKTFSGYVTKMQSSTLSDLDDYTQGGDRKWNKTVVTKGKLDVGRPHVETRHYYESEDLAHPTENLVTIPDNYPYAVDQITLPFDNPWNSWIRPSGLDFFKDGRMVMSTYAGDVWVATGINDDLMNIQWQRIATGLYDPFGVKVKDGDIYVTCRDRIVRLKDLNGDGETDFYENFHSDTDVSGVQVQAYNYSLETDKDGNFVYSKGGQYTSDDEPGNLIQVSPDGKHQSSIATGFRAPNGVTITPDNQIFVSDNQGNWMPANKINIVKEGGFYGYIPTIEGGATPNGPKEYKMKPDLAASNYPDQILPDTFDQPIIWMPQNFDNSPGNGSQTPKDWGPMGDQLIWTSYGKGWAYQVLMQQVDGVTQAAVAALPFQFDAGTQRARINPSDGQYYLAGVTGWDDSEATKYGSIDRIRYTGGQGFIMEAVKVLPEGIEITFNQSLAAESTAPSNYHIEQWNYRWQQRYGSEQWSVKHPDQNGHDVVQVQSGELSDDGKSVILKLPSQDLIPVDQMQVHLSVTSKDNEHYEKTIYLTIRKVPGK